MAAVRAAAVKQAFESMQAQQRSLTSSIFDRIDSLGRSQLPTANPRLIAIDVNGTLLNDGQTVTPATSKVIEAIQHRGCHCVIVSGQPFARAQGVAAASNANKFIVCSNGAAVLELPDGLAIYEHWVPGDEALSPVQALRSAGLGTFAFGQLTSDGGYLEQGHPWLTGLSPSERAVDLVGKEGKEGKEFTRMVKKMFSKRCTRLEDVLKPDVECAKAYVTKVGETDIGSCLPAIQSCMPAGWVTRELRMPGMEGTFELQSTSVNKAVGLSKLCEALAIPMEEVWAFGDDLNDLQMLTEVGWGVAMLNASDTVKAVANDVTEFSNDDDGLAKYLTKHVLRVLPEKGTL